MKPETTLATLHVHSTWSYDGQWSLEQLAALFRPKPTRVLMMTEHDRGFSPEQWRAYREACAAVSGDQLLVMPGMEYSEPTNTIHILVWGDLPFLGENRPTMEILEAVSDHGGAAVLAHPTRKEAWHHMEDAWAEHLIGMEIWNRKTDGIALSRDALALLGRYPHLTPFVGLDFHRRRQMFPLAMELAMTEPVSESAVVDALTQGRLTPKVAGQPLNTTGDGPMNRIFRWAEHARSHTSQTVHRMTGMF